RGLLPDPDLPHHVFAVEEGQAAAALQYFQQRIMITRVHVQQIAVNGGVLQVPVVKDGGGYHFAVDRDGMAYLGVYEQAFYGRRRRDIIHLLQPQRRLAEERKSARFAVPGRRK